MINNSLKCENISGVCASGKGKMKWNSVLLRSRSTQLLSSRYEKTFFELKFHFILWQAIKTERPDDWKLNKLMRRLNTTPKVSTTKIALLFSNKCSDYINLLNDGTIHDVREVIIILGTEGIISHRYLNFAPSHLNSIIWWIIGNVDIWNRRYKKHLLKYKSPNKIIEGIQFIYFLFQVSMLKNERWDEMSKKIFNFWFHISSSHWGTRE